MIGRAALVGAGWTAAAIAAAMLAVEAVDLVGTGILNAAVSPLTPADVARELREAAPGKPATPTCSDCVQPTSAPTTSSSPATMTQPPSPTAQSTTRGETRTATTAPATTSATRSLSTAGGTVVAQCRNDLAQLVSWSPAQGYRVGSVAAGPAGTTSLTFRSGRDDDGRGWQVRVTCVNGIPSSSTVRVADDD